MTEMAASQDYTEDMAQGDFSNESYGKDSVEIFQNFYT